jgi:hypothetical protein
MEQPSITSTNPDYLVGIDGGHMVRVPVNAPDGQRANIGLSQAQIAAGAAGVAGVSSSDTPVGLRGVAGESRGLRPRLLVFGNSIASQSAALFVGASTLAASDVRSGATSITAASAQTISAGAKIVYRVYTGEWETNTVASTVTAATTIPLTTPTRKAIRSGSLFTVYATAGFSNIRQSFGMISTANAMLGGAAEIIYPGYGYGSATIQQVVSDLPAMLARTNPHFVALHLLENSVATGESWEGVLKPWLHRAVEECLRFGATPIVFSCLPYTVVNDAAKSAVWDAQKTYILDGGLVAAYPQCRVVDASNPWLDTSFATERRPLASIASDGVHPDSTKRFYVGAQIVDTLAKILPSARPGRALSCLNANPTLTGTGGSSSGAGWSGSVATSYTATAEAGVTAVGSKNADGSQKLVMSIAGASNVGTTRLLLTCTNYTVPLNFGAGMAIRFYVKLRVNSATNISLIYPSLNFSGGETHSVGQNEADNATDPAMQGRELVLESTSIPVPDGATTMSLILNIRPQTLVSPSGVTDDIDVIELGVEPSVIY